MSVSLFLYMIINENNKKIICKFVQNTYFIAFLLTKDQWSEKERLSE